MEEKKDYTKIYASISLFLLIASVLPMLILGHYDHPTGDDYFFGVETYHAWENTHSLSKVFAEAGKGVTTQYQIWQGTYSAMFLMYLPPNIFGDTAYHIASNLLLLMFISSLFFLLHMLLCGILKCSISVWLTLSAMLSMLCIQTVPCPEESFYWYNGSMYYTGFFTVSLYFFSIIYLYIKNPKSHRVLQLSFLGLFLAGGNYVSLLPTMLLTGCILVCLVLYKRYRQSIGLLIVLLCLLIGFTVSALAPGNQVRQDGMWKISAKLAIYKAISQGITFITAWTSLWFLVLLLVLTPLLWKQFERINLAFRYPLFVIGVAFGIFSSMTCPTYYTMNSPGPARAIAIIYYGYVLFFFFSYTYLLGYVHRFISTKKGSQLKDHRHITPHRLTFIIPLAVSTCLIIMYFSNAFAGCNGVRALICLINGEAAAYEDEYQERLAVLTDPTQTDVVFNPYVHQADLLYVGDLGPDPTAPSTVRVAAYFDKNSICVNWD